MTPEQLKEILAPCGLCCETCFAYTDGDIRKYSMKLKAKLGNFHLYAERFVSLLENPIFKKYPDFKEMLDYLAAENCQGCRNEQCKLFKNCGVRACHQKKQINFCYQCDKFPCDKTNFDTDLYKGWVIINKKIKEKGVEQFAKEARDRSRYP